MSESIQLYTNTDGEVQLDIKLEQETLWLTQAQLAELFQVKPQNITMHLKRVFAEGELDSGSTCKDFLQVQSEGSRQVKRNRKHYNLDAIISVGYRVNSARAAHLLYFVIKNNPLADGNKRTGSFLFLWYLQLNQHLLAKPIERLINDNTLVALALLVAESKPDQKELMIRLVEHFILLKAKQ